MVVVFFCLKLLPHRIKLFLLFVFQVVLTNLSSVNPTRVNGEILQQSERLKHGDVITIIDRSFRLVSDNFVSLACVLYMTLIWCILRVCYSLTLNIILDLSILQHRHQRRDRPQEAKLKLSR